MSDGDGMKRTVHMRIASLTMCAALLFGYIFYFQIVYGQASAVTGTVSVSDVLNVRTDPGTNNAVLKDKDNKDVQLPAGHQVTVLSTHSSTDGGSIEWYKVTFTFSGQTLTGYVRSDYIIIYSPPVDEELSADFEASIKDFPDSYKPYLRALHLARPNWVFKALKTNLNWDTVVQNETVLGRSLTSSSTLSYRSTAPGAYDWSTDEYIMQDGGGWYQAADDVVRYYLDPRNFLDEKNVFQFELLSFDSKVQTKSGVETMLSGTFMDGKYISNGSSQITYSQAFMDAANASGASPYHLVSRVIQEVGRQGSSSVSGTYSGYEGYYNFYNIGASSGTNPILNGLNYAKTGGSLSAANKTKYLIPWNSQYKSIVGGAKWIASNYISIGQNTLYLQKFDVDSSDGGLYWHQYMTNIGGAASEAGIMYSTYKDIGALDLSLTFYIPVYNNMPAERCDLPVKKGNPNNLLKTLSVSGYSITPTFKIESDTSTYYLILDGNIKKITVNATAVSSLASVSGNTGNVAISEGVNNLKISVKAQNGDVKTYSLVVVLNDKNFKPGDEVTAPTNPTENAGFNTNYNLSGGMVTGIAPATAPSKFIGNLNLYGGAQASLTNAKGAKLTSGYVGTGDKLTVTVNGKSGVYTAVVRGDTDGDGEITAVDLLMVRKNILGLYKLSGEYSAAADTDRNSKVDAVDLLMIRKHILKTYTIEQK